MVSEDFAFFGFDDLSWNRLVALLLGEGEESPRTARGVLVVAIGGAGLPVAAFHTAEGAIDPGSLPPLDDLSAFCEAMCVGACVLIRERALDDVAEYLTAPLDPNEDFVTRVMRFARVSSALGDGNLLRVWPNPIPDLLQPAASAAKPAGEALLPDEHSAVFVVFDEGDLWTAAVAHRHAGQVDTLAGPEAVRQWTGPLGGAWRRDHRVIVKAVERELGPVHIGVFMERGTAEAIFVDRSPAAWATSFANRDLLVHPLPGVAAAALGASGVAGLVQYAFQAIEDMDPDEVARIAVGFWHGLTEGKGLAGLLGFSPTEVVAEVLRERSNRPPRSPRESGEPPENDPSD